jgi:hypothetical protein
MRTRPLLVILSLTLLLGCRSDSKKKPDPEPSTYLPQTSITSVLSNLAQAYTKKNYEEYQKLIDSSFEYIFAPQDIGGENNIPASWGRADELASANHMFNGAVNRDGYRAEEIRLAFTAGADTPTDLDPAWRKVVLSNINLQIDSRHETSSDPLTYDVNGDKAELYFFLTGEIWPGTDQHIWKIVRWDDKPIAKRDAKTQSLTWGQIKGNYR